MIQILVVDSESAEHESAESRYTKMREGEFVGKIPGAFGEGYTSSSDHVAGSWRSGSMKKQQDPAEMAEGEF